MVHIHSGKFDRFCSGFSDVVKNLNFPNSKTVVLESRWKEKLADWIPSDSLVVNNFSNLSVDRSQHKIGGRINLLLMSRGSRIKGHNFAKMSYVGYWI